VVQRRDVCREPAQAARAGDHVVLSGG
jgi:hypothetical protein